MLPFEDLLAPTNLFKTYWDIREESVDGTLPSIPDEHFKSRDKNWRSRFAESEGEWKNLEEANEYLEFTFHIDEDPELDEIEEEEMKRWIENSIYATKEWMDKCFNGIEGLTLDK